MLTSIALALIAIVSGALALGTYASMPHRPPRARQTAVAGTVTATATATQPAPTPTASGLTVSRVTAALCSGGNPPPPQGVVSSGASAPNEVALTFDDGPTPYSTPAILDALERTHTPATFFVLGQYVSSWPSLLQREASDGFAIGIHTWNHPDMTTLTPNQQTWQLSATEQAIHNALGSPACVWFWRPPYGAYNQQVLQTAASLRLTTVTWDDDPADWSRPGTSVIVQRVLSEVHAGSIVLMHDGPSLRQETADALPDILAGLKARGLRPVTLPQLLADGSASHTASGPAGGTSPTLTETRDAAMARWYAAYAWSR